MELLKSIKLHSLLMRLALSSTKPLSDPLVIERQGHTPVGTNFDIYQHCRKTLATCVAIHGVTVNGGRDARLINFARNLAHFGITCVVPTLKGLAACQWEPRDLDELVDIVTLAANEHQQPVGLIGFSFGGSYALIVAGRPEVSKHIQWVITFGAYHNLEHVFEEYLANLDSKSHSDTEWDDAIYQRLVFLYGHRDTIAFSPEVWQEMEILLRRYCCEASIEEKRRFYDRHLHNLDIAGVIRRSLEPAVLKKLSPAGNMSSLKCPVTLIHDRHDNVVPPVQAERLLSELQTLHGANCCRLVMTSLLSHVSPSDLLKVHEIVQLAHALAPLVE